MKCEHGYEIESEDKLPSKRFYRRIEVCKECAIISSLTQLGSGIELDREIVDELVKKLEER